MPYTPPFTITAEILNLVADISQQVELFGVQRPVITKHLKNTFESNELQEKVVCSILEHTTGRSAVEN
ncbi:MAG: hypothetical protein ACJA2U_002630 [Marinomonas primoryensis]|jgi:hypothetical protein